MNKKLLTIAIAGAIVTPITVQAVKYKLSGQVNRSIVFMDDGVQSDIRNADAITSGTRFRLLGSEGLGNGMTVGFFYEMQTSSAPSDAAFPDQDSDGANGVTGGSNIRQANVWFSGNWGKVSMGQIDGAANGATEADLSGTGNVLYHGRTDHTGGIRWRTSGGGTIGCGAATPCTAGNTFNELDAFSRYDGVRYDSPALGPVTLGTSVGNDSKWEVVARVHSALGGGQLSGALFYGEASGALNVDNRWGGSASYLFSQGSNLTVAYAESEAQSSLDSDVWNVKLGHKWGPHAVAIQYGEADDIAAMGFEDTGWGIGYNHSLKKANTDLYAGYLHQELDTPTGTGPVEDISAFVIGARVQFD